MSTIQFYQQKIKNYIGMNPCAIRTISGKIFQNKKRKKTTLVALYMVDAQGLEPWTH